MILILAGRNKAILQALGALRLHMAKEIGILKDNHEYKFVWVTEFPLLSYDEEEKRYVAEHHPFTMPMDEDIQYLDTDPGRVRAKAYDIVLNGEELGGGSIRIHDTKLQEKCLKYLALQRRRHGKDSDFCFRHLSTVRRRMVDWLMVLTE